MGNDQARVRRSTSSSLIIRPDGAVFTNPYGWVVESENVLNAGVVVDIGVSED
jgi:hypothetical protein